MAGKVTIQYDSKDIKRLILKDAQVKMASFNIDIDKDMIVEVKTKDSNKQWSEGDCLVTVIVNDN